MNYMLTHSIAQSLTCARPFTMKPKTHTHTHTIDVDIINMSQMRKRNLYYIVKVICPMCVVCVCAQFLYYDFFPQFSQSSRRIK